MIKYITTEGTEKLGKFNGFVSFDEFTSTYAIIHTYSTSDVTST